MPRLPTPPPRPTATFGPYRVVGRISFGGMGVVYRACHVDTDAEVALKTVLDVDPADVAALRREIHALTRLEHPGVVRFVDHGVTQGQPWYAMELIRGRPLRALLAEVYPSPGEGSVASTRPRRVGAVEPLLAVLADVCRTLAYLHGHGVVHRDLKPENVVLRADGSPVLIDFGIASAFTAGRAREALDALVRSAGTVLYMSPEQVLGQVVDPRADLYSLGCMLYECLTGAPPFISGDVMAVAFRQMNELPAAPSMYDAGVSTELERLALRLLQKHPENRPGYAETIADVLERHDGRTHAAARRAKAPVYLYRPQLTGRGRELARALEHLRTLRRGRGGVLLVTGESGAGKTRLVLEAAAAAIAQNVTVVSGAGVALDARREADVRAAPFHPLANLFTLVADACRADPDVTERLLGAQGRVLAEIVPDLAALPELARLSTPPMLPPRAARERALDAARDTVLALADSDPLVLVLDDLQWADELTITLLQRLAASDLTEHPLLVLGSWRGEESTPALDALSHIEGVETLRLGRLDGAAVRDMVRGMLALDTVPESLADFVYAQSDGNPFFAAEYLRAAAAGSVLDRDADGCWRLMARGEEGDLREVVPQPASIGELLRRRLTGLDPDATRLVQTAAVLGREFDGELLGAVAGLDERRCLTGLGALRAREIVEERGRGHLRFVHDRLREVAYADIPEADARALHGRAAGEMEARAPTPQQYAALAHHLSRAGDPARAARYFTLAGDHARRTWASSEAVEHYRAALEAHRAARAGVTDDAERVRVDAETLPALRERVADLCELLARDDEARAALEQALTEVDVARVAWRARLLRKCAKTYETQHQHGAALARYDEAMAALGEAVPAGEGALGAPDHPSDREAAWWDEWVQVQIERAWVHYWLAQPEAMRALVDRVAPVVEARGSAAQRARFYQAVVHGGLREGRYRVSDEMVTAAERSLDAAREANDLAGLSYARFVYGMVFFFGGRIAEAEARLREAYDDTSLTGDVVMRLRCVTYRMLARRLRGDDAEVAALAGEALTLATRLKMDDYVGVAHGCKAWAAWRVGDHETADEEARVALETWAALAAKYAYPLTWVARFVALARTNLDDALRVAIDHVEALRAPTQQRLPEALERDLDAALRAWETHAPDDARRALEKVLLTAQAFGYL